MADGVVTMGRIKFIDRLFHAIRDPGIPHPASTDELDEINKDLLDRVKKLQEQATIDQEEGWFLCLTKNKEVCEESEDDVKNG